jgi:hypothetical protein
VANKTVKIYERVKVHGKWTDRSVEIPDLKPDGTMYLKDNREGNFAFRGTTGKARSGTRRPARPSAKL